jgi:hypothetical protein
VNSIETGGNLYLNSCHVDDKLASSVADLSNKTIHIFYTKDEISMNGNMDDRRINEGKYSYTWSPKQKTYLFKNDDDFNSSMSSVTKGASMQKLKKNIILQS